MKKILIINPFGIGDVLFSTPLIAAVKAKHPAVSIDYICNKRAYGVVKDNPRLSKIYIFEKDHYRKLWNESKVRFIKDVSVFLNDIKKERYDVVFDASLGYLFCLLLAIVARIPVRAGFNFRRRGRFLTHKLNVDGFSEKHAVEYYLDLGRMLGIEPRSSDMELFISPEDRGWAEKYLSQNGIMNNDKICAIIPGCGASWGKDAKYRRLSPWKFAKIADHIHEAHGFKIMVFGESSERELCSEVLSNMKSPGVQSCGMTTLNQFAAIIDRCGLIITNDGGPLHLAVALKKKIVAVFGPVDEKVYGPYPNADRYMTITSKAECRPCYRNFKYVRCEKIECLKKIEPADIIKAVDVLVKA